MHRSLNGPAGRRARGGRLRFDAAVRRLAGAALAAVLLVAGGQGVAGHSVGHYPSYYPAEISIESMDPASAAARFREESLHAYLGGTPAFGDAVPAHVHTVTSLGAFLVVLLDERSAHLGSADKRCAAVRDIVSALGGTTAGGFVFHPFPVTPYHPDYLHHLDRAATAAAAMREGSATPAALRIGARGRLAEALAASKWSLAAQGADVVLEEVATETVIAAAGPALAGWPGLPWAKEGWYQAFHILAPALDPKARAEADEIYRRLANGEVASIAERVNLERRLVMVLTSDCRRAIAGYWPRVEYVDDHYPGGIENIAFDSHAGLNSPVFVRTVKLKEYPWNGKLLLGSPVRSASAWNPVAGFTDPVARMVWNAVGDPAMIAFPFNSSWMQNRVQTAETRMRGQSGGIRLPDDALVPAPGTGALGRVEGPAFASIKVDCEVLASPFEDGTSMAPADAIYPFVFGYRWGLGARAGDVDDPVARLFAEVHEHLAGLRLVRVEKSTHAVAEGMEIVHETPVLEIYLRNAPGDELQTAALAPPWSTVPWHLLVLMEEAVSRGLAAFSEAEAARRNLPWLDLVRDQALVARLLELTAAFERDAFRPDTLKDYVTAEEARQRWASLRRFAESRGHFLVANGPYRLKSWSPDTVVLEAVRELSYPLGFGTFDRFVNPPRAVLESVTQEAGSFVVAARAEMVLKMGRDYKLTSEPLTRTTMRGLHGLLVGSRYLVVDSAGNVVSVDKMQWRDDGRFAFSLPGRLPAGEYTVVVAVILDGNTLLPSARILRVRVGEGGTPG